MQWLKQWSLARKNAIIFGKGVKKSLALAVKYADDAEGNEIHFGEQFRCGKLEISVRGKGNKIVFQKNVRFGGKITIQGNGVELNIGENCHIVNAYIVANRANITIGANSLISREVVIRSSDIHHLYHKGEDAPYNHPEEVVIGEHVWIGARAFISKGSSIPSECMIGACSFINKTFEKPHCVIAGNPAQVVKEDIKWKR